MKLYQIPPHRGNKYTAIVAVTVVVTAVLFAITAILLVTEDAASGISRQRNHVTNQPDQHRLQLRGDAASGNPDGEGEGWTGNTRGKSISRAFHRLLAYTTTTLGTDQDSEQSKAVPNFTDDEDESQMFPLEQQEHSREQHHHHAWHKPLHPINGWDIAGVSLACVGLMIAAAGGIGGGGILVPLYILVLQFHPKHAIPLSNITIFGGAITNTVLNMSKRHPDADRPLVDWDLILVMEPLTIGGALIGSFINKVGV